MKQKYITRVICAVEKEISEIMFFECDEEKREVEKIISKNITDMMHEIDRCLEGRK
jgi:hypothetical protein